MKNLYLRAFRSSLLGTLTMAALLFLPPWTLKYWQAWVFMAVFVSASVAITAYLAMRDPKLLERRMNVGPIAEKEKPQKIIMFLAMTAYCAEIRMCCRRDKSDRLLLPQILECLWAC
jgi:hypothetical protein